MERNWDPPTLLVGMQNGAATLGKSGVPQEIRQLSCDPAILLPRSREMKTYVYPKTYTQVFKDHDSEQPRGRSNPLLINEQNNTQNVQ
jgi:hypothetical protein